MPKPRFYADSMAVIGLHDKPPVFSPWGRPKLSLAHLTSVSPSISFYRNFEVTILAHRIFMAQALSNRNVHAVLTKDDVEKPGSMGLLFGLQHAPEGLTRERVQQLYDVGVRSMALVCDEISEYGSSFESSTVWITEKGIELVRWLGEVGIILDLTGANHRTTTGALSEIIDRQFDTEVMVSHSGCYAVHPHPRNLRDQSISQICFLQGYIGIPATTSVIATQDDSYLKAFARHVAHAIKVWGDADFVGIGSDCNHIDMSMSDAQAHFVEMLQILKSNGSVGEYFPDRPPELIENGLRMFECIEEALGKQATPGLLGENFGNFLQRALR